MLPNASVPPDFAVRMPLAAMPCCLQSRWMRCVASRNNHPIRPDKNKTLKGGDPNWLHWHTNRYTHVTLILDMVSILGLSSCHHQSKTLPKDPMSISEISQVYWVVNHPVWATSPKRTQMANQTKTLIKKILTNPKHAKPEQTFFFTRAAG